jgi:hypothetical protein
MIETETTIFAVFFVEVDTLPRFTMTPGYLNSHFFNEIHQLPGTPWQPWHTKKEHLGGDDSPEKTTEVVTSFQPGGNLQLSFAP